jgi:peptidoglycan/LPS O-acetylase OafA/YrhL
LAEIPFIQDNDVPLTTKANVPTAPLPNTNEPQPTESEMGRTDSDQWAVLAGLRFALAFIVVSSHLPGYTSPDAFLCQFGKLGAFAAVLGFFIISGYSMAHSLTEQGGVSAFYERRFWRIYPMYIWALVLAELPFFLTQIVFPHSQPGLTGGPSRIQFAVAAVFGNGIVAPEFPGNGVLWTLTIEVVLYAFCPLFARCSRKVLIGMIAISAALFLLHNHTTLVPYYHEEFGAADICLAWAFIGGFAFYRHREKLGPLPLLTLVAVLLTCDIEGPTTEYYASATMVAATACVWYADTIRLSIKVRRVFIWLGNLSFCLYVVHVPMMLFCAGISYRNSWGIMAACLLLAIATYYVIDLPIRTYVRWRNTRLRSVSTTH